MKSVLLAQAERAVESAPAFQVVGKTHQSVGIPVLNVSGQAVPAAASVTTSPSGSAALPNDAVANSILSPTMTSYFEILGYLLLVLACVWLLLWLLRRSGVGMFSPERQIMAIESRLSLGPKKWMVVTRVHGKRLVLGVTDHTITKLVELPPVHHEPRANQGKVTSLKRALTAPKMLKKKAQPSSSVQPSPELELPDELENFEKFYTAAQEQGKKE